MRWKTKVCTPVIRDNGTCNEEEPFLHTLWAMLLIDAIHCFEKNLRCQVLGIFSMTDLAIHKPIDRPSLLLIKLLEFPRIHTTPLYSIQGMIDISLLAISGTQYNF